MLVGYQVPDINPLEGLLMCVRISAAEVAYFSQMLEYKGDEGLTGRPRSEAVAGKDPEVFDLKGERQLSIWYKARKSAMNDLARFSKMALDAGVAERQVRIAEQMGDMLARFIQGVLDALQLTKAQKERAPEIVRQHLTLAAVAGGGQ